MRILDSFLSLLRRVGRFFTACREDSRIRFLRIHDSSRAREEVFPGLFVRELESRRVLSASGVVVEEVGRNLVIGAGLQASSTPETIELSRQGDTLQVSVNGQMTATAQLEQISTIKLQAASDQDTFILNFSGGYIAPSGGIQVNGVQGPQGSLDKLVLESGSATAPITSLTQQSTGVGSGLIQVPVGPSGSPSGGTAAIEYSGLGSVQDSMTAQQLTVIDSLPADTLTVTGNAAQGQITIASSQGTEVTLAAPQGGLTIQAGANSTVDFIGVTNLQGGNLTVSAGSIVVDGTLTSHGGSISLDAGASGTLLVSGTIDVSNTASEEIGGNVQLLGNRVGLLDQALVDASGNAGGGTVLIGGGLHGANAEVLDASYTYIGPDVQISADVLAQGNGGQVVVWSNVETQFLGDISAQGGSLGGNGGSIETSSKQYLDVGRGSVTAAAANGRAGTWLLDPENVTIAAALTGGTFSGGNPNIFTPNADNATVDAGTIDASLNGGTSVTITTGSTGSQDGDITVSASILCSVAGAGTPTLLLDAAEDIAVYDPISGSAGAALNVALAAGGNVTVSSAITTYGGTFSSSGVAFDNTGGAISTAGGSAVINQTGTVTIGSAIETDAGSLMVTGSSIAGSGMLTVGGGLTTDTSSASGNQSLTASGTVGITSLNAGAGTITLNGGTFSLSADNGINAASSVNIEGATLDVNSQNETLAELTLASGSITGTSGTLSSGGFALDSGSVTAILGGSGAVIKSAGGTLSLSGADSYSGGTTIDTGFVLLGNAAALGTGGLTMNGGVLNLDGNSVTVASLSGTGGIITDNFGTTGTSTLTVDQSSSTSFSGILVANGTTRQLALEMSGSGVLALDGANSYSGGTTIDSGSVILGNSIALGSGGLTMNGGTLDLNAHSITVTSLSGTGGTITDNNASSGVSTFTVDQSATTSFAGTIADGATRQLALVMSGGGSLTLDGSNSYSGGTTIDSGSLVLGSPTALGSAATASVTFSAASTGTLKLNGNSITLAALNTSSTLGSPIIENGASANAVLTLNNTVANTYAGLLQDGGAGTLALVKSGAGTLTLSGANTYTGGTNLDEATLVLASSGAIGTLGSITFVGGTLEFTSANTNDYSTRIKNSTASVSLNTNGQNVTMAGTIDASNVAGLTKLGGGTLLLSRNNSYSGVTTISAGTIQLGSGTGLGSTNGGIVVAAGAVLDLNGQIVGDEAVSIDGSGIAGTGSLINSSSSAASLNGAVTLTGNSIISNNGNLALTGGISGDFVLTLLGPGNLNSSAAPLNSTVSGIVDNKSGGSVFISQGAEGVNLSGAMTNGSNLNLADAGTTTLVGPLNAGSGNVTLSGGVSGGANLLTANTLTLQGGGSVGASGSPLMTQVNSLLLGKTGGDSFLSQDTAVPLTVTGITAGNLTLTAGNTTIASGGLTAAGGLLMVDSLAINALIDMGDGSLVTSGPVTFDAAGSTLAPTVQAGGGQTYGGVATLEANTVLTSDNNVIFDQTIDRNAANAWDLTIDAGQGTMTANTIYASEVINAGGNISFDGVVGGGANGPIGILTLSGHGAGSSSIDMDHNVTTASGQTYEANIVLDASVTLRDSGGRNLVMMDAVDSDGTLDANGNSPWSLTLQSNGSNEISGPVGATSPLSGLLVEGYSAAGQGNTILSGGSIVTSGTAAAGHVTGQTYDNAVILAANSALSDDSGNNIIFNSTVNSQAAQNWGLTASTAGNEVFNAAVGGSEALASLTIDASGTVGGAVVFNFAGSSSAPTVTTTGSQTYYDAVQLEQNTALSAGGDISAFSTVDSAGSHVSLTLTASGNVTFNGSIGGSDELQNLVVTQAASVVFGGASIQGPDPRSSGPVGEINTAGTIDIGQASPVGSIVFNAGPGAASTLSVNSSGQNVTLNGPVTLDSSLTFGRPAMQMGTVDFASSVVSLGMDYNNLAIYAGTVDFHGNVGRFVPDPVGNPDPNLALGTATFVVSDAINIDPGVEIRVWHENLGIPGGVSQITPVLHLGPQNPPPASPSNPTQTIIGSFGLSPNYTEYGENFTIVVKWADSVTTTYTFDPGEFAKSNLNAGGTLNLFVNADGSINWAASSLNPGTGSGGVNFTITRTYPLSFLATVTQQGLHASVTIVTDSSVNFTIAGVRITGTTADASVTPVAGGRVGLQFTAEETPPIEFQAYSAPAAEVVTTTQVTSVSTLSGDQPVRQEVKKVVRHFEIVKVDVEGNEGEPNPLPDETLENMPALLKRFIKSLPNGRYRIYLIEGVEGGVQTSRLIREFYKSGKSLGDPVHEIGPGSIEGEQPAAPAGNSVPGGNGIPPADVTPAPAGNDHQSGATSQHAPAAVLPGKARARAAQGAILALGALTARRDWMQRINEAMESGAGRSFRRAARLLKQLRKGEKDD